MPNSPAEPVAEPPVTLGEWLQQHGLTNLVNFPDDLLGQPWVLTNADRMAAWELYTEMRTRISTQPLLYRSGVEQGALKSLVTLFDLTRELLRKHGPECRSFAVVCVEVLNVGLRPFTARWHTLSDKGRLAADDGRHQFRGELKSLQAFLRQFQKFLAIVSERGGYLPGTESGFRTIDARRHELGSSIPFDTLLGLNGPSSTAPHDLMVHTEKGEVECRRVAVGLPEGSNDLVGLAISGGGIRSATFALGVLQGIAAKGLLKEVDYLSTVSGGGYIGAFLSSYLNDAATPEDSRTDVGPAADQLPFQRTGLCESGALRSLRNHSKYLLPVGFIGRLKMIGQGMYGVLMNLVILLPLLTGAAFITRYTHFERMHQVAAAVKGRITPIASWDDFSATFKIGAIWLVLVFLLPLLQRISRLSPTLLRWRAKYENACIWLFAVVLGVFCWELIPLGYYAFLRLSEALGLMKGLRVVPGGFWVLIGNLVAFLSARGLLRNPSELKADVTKISIWRKAAFLLLACAGPLLLIVIYYLLCHWLLVLGAAGRVQIGDAKVQEWIVLLVLFVAPLIYSYLFLNVNLISPQRYYRNRLAETYLLKPAAAPADVAVVQNFQLLSQLGRTEKAPYHLINAALNLPFARNDELRGRDSDFFLFSKHYCGSPITGYHLTEEWEQLDGFLDLGTAVAISGAAASSHMGATTPRGASFFLALLNVRLGYWLRRPDKVNLPFGFLKALDAPGPGYLFREMFGCVGDGTRYLNVSDGGHIENLAVYELLRRRCKFIIAIDGECDPALELPSLMRLQQYAWIDFGTSIELDVTRLKLTDQGWSQAHIAFGTINYPGGARGYLLYVKLSVTGNERDSLLDYRARNAPFPHESTIDQLYSEAQFEAYRALGEHVTEDMFCKEFQPRPGEPHDVRHWFQALADNLLDSDPRPVVNDAEGEGRSADFAAESQVEA